MEMFDDIRSRPYKAGEILSKSLRGLFSQHFAGFAVPVLLFLLISLFVYWMLREQIAMILATSYLPESVMGDAEGWVPDREFWVGFRQFMLAMGVIILLELFLVQYVLRRMKHAVCGEDVPIDETIRSCLDPLRVLSLVVTALLAGIMIWVGCLLCLLPGLALMIVYSLLPACVVLNEARFNVPLGQPFKLIAGRIGTTLGVLLPILVVYFVINTVLTLPIMATQLPMMGAGGEPPEPEVMARMYEEFFQSTQMFVLQATGGLVGSFFALILGFATVVIYVNYRSTPRAARTAQEPA